MQTVMYGYKRAITLLPSKNKKLAVLGFKG